MSLWGLVAGTVAISLPLPFLFPIFFVFGGVPAMIAGAILGLQYRTQLIPKHYLPRALSGARAGGLSAGVSIPSVMIIGDDPIPSDFMFGIVGFAAIGAFAGAVAFAFMIPEELKNFGLKTDEC